MSKSNLKNLGRKIKKLRRSLRPTMNQVDLAVATHLSPSYIGAIERGERQPSLKALNKIAKVLGVEIRDIL